MINSGQAEPKVTTLENGLEIITHVRRQHPVAAIQVWCKTGSIHEGKWMGAGLSHVLEHMLFKGTESRPPGEIDREVQDAGGNMNAYTSFDHTVYYINVPSEGVELAVDILCDITCHATIPEEELASEKDVILREMDMLKDDPGRRSSRRLFENAFHISPLRYPIIGLPDIYNQVTREDVVDYYRQRYVPNNLFFVISGDIDEAKVIDQISRVFESRPAQPLPPVYIPSEPVPFGSRHNVEEGPFQLGHAHVGFQIPGISHPDFIPLELLNCILGQGRSSRLNQKLRESMGIVHGIQSWHYCPGDQGLLAVSATIDADRMSEVEKEIFHVISELIQNPVTTAELARAKKLQKTAILSGLKTAQGIAEDLGTSWFSTGALDYSNSFLTAMERVTAEDLQRAATNWLSPDKSTFYALLPEGSTNASSRAETSSNRGLVTKESLSNGVTLLTCFDESLPFVETRWATRGGVLMESPETQGSSQLLSKILGKGSRSHTSEEIANLVEGAGGSLDAFAGNNTIGTSMECLDSDWRELMHLTAEVMLVPEVTPETFEIEKQTQLASIKSQEDQLVHLAFKKISKFFYGESGYGLNPQGTEEIISKVTQSEILSFHRALMAPEATVISVFGAVDHDEIVTTLEKAIQDCHWGHDEKSVVAYPSASPAGRKQSSTTFKKVNKSQAVVAIGYQTTTIHNSHKFALDLLQEVYSDLGSRLFTRIRDELGLAYYVSAYHLAGIHPGIFSFYAGTAPDQSDKVAEEFLQEFQHLIQNGITQEELDRAKSKILGQKKISAQSLGTMAMSAALDELYGLGFDNYYREIEAYKSVCLEDIKAVAHAYFLERPYCLSIVSAEAPKRDYEEA